VSDSSVEPVETPRPVFKIVRGDATPEEIAALVTVLASMSGGTEPTKPEPSSTWADPARRMRTTLPHGPGAWRASGLPV
jgi:hypothetical protein